MTTRRMFNLPTALSAVLRVAAALCVLIAGCRRNVQRPYPGLGVPDLIEDRDVEVSRYYLPSRPPAERWPHADRIHYYLAERKRVVLRPGGSEVHLPLDDETAKFVERRLDDLRTGPN